MASELTQQEAIAFFADLYFGEHHIPARGCCGAHGVKKWAPGSYYVNHYGDMATYDYDFLTRLVFLAHDRCFRASVQNSGPRLVKVIIFKRDRNAASMCERHPTIEGALAEWRKRHPAEKSEAPHE
jgi:hypothetical protein